MKLETATLAPAEGRRVRHPDGRLLDAAGETVALTPYWRRRIADRDVAVAPVSSKPRRQRRQNEDVQ